VGLSPSTRGDFEAAAAGHSGQPLHAAINPASVETGHGFLILNAHTANVRWVLSQSGPGWAAFTHVFFLASNELMLRPGIAEVLGRYAAPDPLYHLSGRDGAGMDQHCAVLRNADGRLWRGRKHHRGVPWSVVSSDEGTTQRSRHCPATEFAGEEDGATFHDGFWPELRHSPLDDPALLELLRRQRARLTSARYRPPANGILLPTTPMFFEGTYLRRDLMLALLSDYEGAASNVTPPCVVMYPTSEVMVAAWLMNECAARPGDVACGPHTSIVYWCDDDMKAEDYRLQPTPAQLRQALCHLTQDQAEHAWRRPYAVKRVPRDPQHPLRSLIADALNHSARHELQRWCEKPLPL
jgi:hypothetical protein